MVYVTRWGLNQGLLQQYAVSALVYLPPIMHWGQHTRPKKSSDIYGAPSPTPRAMIPGVRPSLGAVLRETNSGPR